MFSDQPNTTAIHDGSYVFSVGRSDHNAESIAIIHSLGLKAGLFADINHPPTIKQPYDIIIPIDFSQLDKQISSLLSWKGAIKGLLCTYENYIVSKATLGDYLEVPTLSKNAAMNATDKSAMRKAFIDYDPTISPAFALVDALDDALAFTRDYGYPVIIKPTNLVKSLLVIRCNNEDELRTNLTYAQNNIKKLYEKYGVYDHKPQLIIEEFISGPMYSIAGFVDNTGTLVSCPGATELVSAQMIHKADNYLYSRTLPAAIDSPLLTQMLSVAQKGVTALGLTSCPAHIELIIGSSGIKLVEIGARIGGYRPRMYKMSYDIDMAAVDIANSIGNDIKTRIGSPQRRATTSVYELFADEVGSLSSIDGPYDQVKLICSYVSQKVTIGQTTGPSKDGYKAAAVIICSDKDIELHNVHKRTIESLSIEVSS